MPRKLPEAGLVEERDVGDYDRELEWLLSLEFSKGIDLKLERVLSALRQVGRPHEELRCIHVAGTNGKGSVIAFLLSILSAAGYRVGAYTSPHLIDLTERIRIGADEISCDDLARLSAEVRRRVVGRGIDLTFFEVLTVIAFLYFAEKEVDVVLLEVGLGGRFDATNVIDPLVSVITSIGVDHVKYLGDSERAIAGEKAGVIKTGRPAVVAMVGEDAGEVIAKQAMNNDAPLYRAGFEYEFSADEQGRLGFRGMGWQLEGLEVGLVGAHQLANAATAIAAIAAIGKTIGVSESDLRNGLRAVCWPGRFETVLQQPRTVLDGAHNVAAMQALVAEVERHRGSAALHLLFASMRDKEWEEMVDMLGPRCDAVVATEVIPERAVDCATLASAFGKHVESVSFEKDAGAAFDAVLRGARADDLVLVTGSLFLVGKIRQILRDSARISEWHVPIDG